MSSEQSSYRSIAKGTAIFGGVQVFQMLINILRGKFIAIFLGPAGMGVSTMLSSTVNMISQFSSLGLGMGAMRELSMANEQGDVEKLSVVARVFRRLVVITGLLGAVVSMAGARWWSRLTFGDGEYTWAFVVLGAMLFFTSLASGETTLLQGTRKLKALARTSLIGASAGLVVGVPMYYFWGVGGIAPAMVVLALATYLSNRYFARQIELKPVRVEKGQAREYARTMISLGVMLVISQLLGSLSMWFINWFIRYAGNLEHVGFYQAATTITSQCVNFIFAALAVDYLPRLAAISEDRVATSKSVNQQGEMLILLVAPIVVGLLAATPFIVRLLLAPEFMVTIPVIRWMGFALFFKGTSFAFGYMSFAKGDKHVFLWLEGVVGNALNILFVVTCYLLWGYVGLGVSMLTGYVVYLSIILATAYWRYGFRFERGFVRLFVVLLGLCSAAFAITFLVDDYLWCLLIVGVVLVATCMVSWRELNKRMDVLGMIRDKFKKR